MALRVKQEWTQRIRGGDRAVSDRFGIDPVTARVLLNRGLEGEEEIRLFLFGTLDDLPDPRLLDQAQDAADLLHESVMQGKKIRIIGDYDADGILSVYILYHTLQHAGAIVSYDVPDRITDGFGMSMRLVENAYRDGIDTIITCDNGIAQIDEIDRAVQLGMKVIVTDHHEPNYTLDETGGKSYLLPAADAIVNPKKPGCRYPNKDLCGAGVAWKLMLLYESRFLVESPAGSSVPSALAADCPIAMETLPFAAAATVTDIMNLLGENRILVKNGLRMLPDTANIGMRALIRCCGLEGRAITAAHIGFIIGPCLNASGRLDTARRAIDLLLETNEEGASSKAQYLCGMNDQRKQMTEDGAAAAFDLIEHTSLIRDRVLIIYLEGVHESVAGIIASRVKDTCHRPVIIFTDTQNPDHLKGSGRSIEEYNMHDALSQLSELFVRFGGHPMAAGVTIRREDLDTLRSRINEKCTLSDEDLMQKIVLDAAPPFSYLTENLIRELSVLEPFGKGNTTPLFGCSRVQLLRISFPGKSQNVVRLLVKDASCIMTAVYFGNAEGFLSYLKEEGGEEETAKLMAGRENSLRLSLAYRPVINEFRSERSIQLQIAHFR